MKKKQAEKQATINKSSAQQYKPVYGRVWCGVLGAVLFATGLLIGSQTNWLGGGQQTESKVIAMSESDCHSVSTAIINVANNHNYNSTNMDAASEVLAELKDVYAQNCNGRVVTVKKTVSQTDTPRTLPEEPCAAVEELMSSYLWNYDEFSSFTEDHLRRADIYSRLSEKGCDKNKELYKKKALREIEIARALSDDTFPDNEVSAMVEIYKKLDMKQEARKFFEKMQHLSDPAIDFIMEVERIFSE